MPAQLVKLQPAPDLVEQVHLALRDAICDGTLAAGTRITQEVLAEQLAVSRQPVLQALRLLKSDGFVEDAPGRGLRVTTQSGKDIVQLYAVRGALDELAARLAARQHHCIDANLLEQGRKASRGRNVKAMIEADLAFHVAIYAASGNPLIERAAAVHWAQLRRVMGAALQSPPQRELVWDEHEAIARAIAAGDEDRAVHLIGQHLREAGRKLARHLDQSSPLHTGQAS